MKSIKSKSIFNKTKKVIPGGVNSPVRSFAAVSSTPFIVKKSKGSLITDVDNNKTEIDLFPLVSEDRESYPCSYCSFQTICYDEKEVGN